jgi:hypothetical protein
MLKTRRRELYRMFCLNVEILSWPRKSSSKNDQVPSRAYPFASRRSPSNSIPGHEMSSQAPYRPRHDVGSGEWRPTLSSRLPRRRDGLFTFSKCMRFPHSTF